MLLESTRGTAPLVTLQEALFRGLAPDGGLYLPRSLPRLDAGDLQVLAGASWPDLACILAERLLIDSVDAPTVRTIVSEALRFPVPLVSLTDRIEILELFHGPTLAFKDVGARFMAGLMSHFRKNSSGTLTILTATSGDTGGAVAQAFHGIAGLRVVVLFPEGQVTERQERQFSTLGGNVLAVGVRGDFDDCQRLAKSAFLDQDLQRAASLTSANSINVGRLLPQTFYYFQAWTEWTRKCGGWSSSVTFSVPSGNFGNLAAGLMAKRMGLPEARFLAATNANDEVPRFLATNQFQPRPSVRTLSTAMDVGDPSNLARILHLYGSRMESLRGDLHALSVSDEETRVTIKRVYEKTGYVLDPHTAVGVAALESEPASAPGRKGVVLATAHPAKFAEVVEPLVGFSIPVPPELAQCLGTEAERRVTPMDPDLEALRELLLSL